MDFHELEAFLALADTLHFARAAAQVYLSPSALSRLLSRLEEEVGVSLFERDTRQVSLTPEGETFLAFARETIHRRDDLKLRLGERDDSLHGILRVYASVTACYSILPPLVEALSREHPALKLSIETGDPSDAADAVREGRAELALDALPPSGFRDLSCYSVRKTPLVFVTSLSGAYSKIELALDSPSAKHQGLLSASMDKKLTRVLSSVPLILPRTGLARDRFDRWIRTHGIKPEIAAETAGNEAVLALARLGLGLGLVPRLVLENGPFAEGLVLYNAGPEFGDYEIGFVQKQASSGTDAAAYHQDNLSDKLIYSAA
jgi:LysR family positive regulator for ilvC